MTTPTTAITVEVRYYRVKDQNRAEDLASRFRRQGFSKTITALNRADGTLPDVSVTIFDQETGERRELFVDEANRYLSRLEDSVSVEILPLENLGDLPFPTYETDGAAGMDLRAAISDPVVLYTHEVKVIPCGFSVALPDGYEAQIRPRSGLAAKKGVTVLNSPGTIDADYRGEVMAILINHGREPFTVNRGDRIAQMVIAPVATARLVKVEALKATSRGDGRFGSTGV